MVPLSMTLSDLWPGFQGHDIFWSRISEKWRVLKTKLLLHTNRKLYLTYGMVLYLVTLTDLYTHCAVLWVSASYYPYSLYCKLQILQHILNLKRWHLSVSCILLWTKLWDICMRSGTLMHWSSFNQMPCLISPMSFPAGLEPRFTWWQSSALTTDLWLFRPPLKTAGIPGQPGTWVDYHNAARGVRGGDDANWNSLDIQSSYQITITWITTLSCGCSLNVRHCFHSSNEKATRMPIYMLTRICAAEMAVRYAALSACRKVWMPSVVPKSTSVTLAVDEKTLPMATITGRTDRQTDGQTECDAICGPS